MGIAVHIWSGGSGAALRCRGRCDDFVLLAFGYVVGGDRDVQDAISKRCEVHFEGCFGVILTSG